MSFRLKGSKTLEGHSAALPMRRASLIHSVAYPLIQSFVFAAENICAAERRKNMANFVRVVAQLQAERGRLEQDLRKLVQAITALTGSTGSATVRGRGKRVSGTRSRLSAAARERIAAAQRARWAKARANKGQKAKRTLSSAARNRIAAAQRARWAKVRQQKLRKEPASQQKKAA